jgi:hypothetical protein
VLAFFKLNDPYRLVGIFLLLLLLRLPAFLGWLPGLQPELGWQLLGENLSLGDSLYDGVWDNSAPLTAGVYWLLDELFGRSTLAASILAMLLLLVQAGLFNSILLNNRAYDQQTYLPALLYIVFAHFFFDAYLLSPPLLCMLFLLLALSRAVQALTNRPPDDAIFFMGFWIGIASLFYLPSLIFLPAFLFSLIIFTGTQPKQYLLLLVGAALPLASAALYFYWQGRLQSFYFNYVLSLSFFGEDNYLGPWEIVIVAIIPTVYTLLGIFQYAGHRYTIFQTRLQLIMFYFMLAAIVAIILSAEKSAYHLFLLVPVWAYYTVHFLLGLKNSFLAEISFWLLPILLIAFNVLVLTPQVPELNQYLSVDRLTLNQRSEAGLTADKKVLILGRDLSLYRNAQLATPYLEWELAERQLTSLNYYDNLTAAYTFFNEDPPEVLVDDAGIVPALFERMPTIASRYTQPESQPGVYLLK